MNRKNALLFGISLLLILFGCKRTQQEEIDESGTAQARVPVKISALMEGTIDATVSAVGSTDALRKQKVLSPVAGRILSLKVLEGSPVRTGDVVVVLMTREGQAAVEGAQSLLRAAPTEPQKQEARRALALADSLQPEIFLRASFDGVIASRNVSEGELVAEQTELLTIIDTSTIVFIADLPICSISAVHPNLPARIRFPQLPLGELSAVVDAVNPQAEAQSQSVKARLRFHGLSASQHRMLKTNLPGTAQIITDVHHNALLLQRSALLHDDESNTYSIVLMGKDSLAHVVPVTVMLQTDSVVEVQSNLLHAGDLVITKGQYALTDSTRVTIEQP